MIMDEKIDEVDLPLPGEEEDEVDVQEPEAPAADPDPAEPEPASEPDPEPADEPIPADVALRWKIERNEMRKAVQAERERHDRLLKMLEDHNAGRKPEGDQPPPQDDTPPEDPDERIVWQFNRMAKITQRFEERERAEREAMQRQEQREQLVTHVFNDYNQFASSEEPRFKDAYEFVKADLTQRYEQTPVRDQRTGQWRAPTEQEIAVQLATDEENFARQVLANGGSVAREVFNYALARGFGGQAQPKAASEAPDAADKRRAEAEAARGMTAGSGAPPKPRTQAWVLDNVTSKNSKARAEALKLFKDEDAFDRLPRE